MMQRVTLLLLFIFCFIFLVAPAGLAHAQASVEETIGLIEAPPGTEIYQEASGEKIGIIFFLTIMIRVFTIGVGVYAAFNFILAAFNFLTLSGESGGMEKAKNQIVQSAIGLLIIVLSYTLTGLVGLIFFGDPAFILNPQL